MSPSDTKSIPMAQLLDDRGAERTVEGHIVSCVVSRDGLSVAFATADGEIYVAPRGKIGNPDEWIRIEAHDGSILCLSADALPDSFLSGGDDNTLRRIGPDGSVTVLHKGRRWVDHVTTWANPKGGTKDGLIAFAAGKQVELRQANGERVMKVLDHDSSVSGIVFDAKGKRIAASHYNGASMWFVQAKVDTPRQLHWKGSHIGIAIHPDSDALVTSMQENDLHGWRLSDGHNMRMSGYPQKVRSMQFTRNGKWLVTSGADAAVMWPFFGGGPMGKPPMELAPRAGVFCVSIACHPQHDIVAVGYADGTIVLAETASQRVLPVCGPGRGAITTLSFSPEGGILAFGTEAGSIGIIDLSTRAP